MKKSSFDHIKQTWREVARYNRNDDFSFELEVHKKLLNAFHVGDYYFYVFNCATAELEYVSDRVVAILGMDSPDQLSAEYLVNNMHPDDRPYFFEFESRVVDFLKTLGPERILKYKMAYDYRVRSTKGDYVRVLQQSVTIQTDDLGSVIRTLGVHTNISHLKKDGPPSLSFIGLEGEPSFHDVGRGLLAGQSGIAALTKREAEILQLLIKGNTSKQIAALLSISKLTADRHRKNMLQKMNCRSTTELAIKMMQQFC